MRESVWRRSMPRSWRSRPRSAACWVRRSWSHTASIPPPSGPSGARCRGRVARPDALVESCVIKAELASRSLDVDCAIANEGSYGPIDRVPLVPSGIEIMAFIDRKRGLRLVETLGTHRTNWRLRRFKAVDPNVPAVVKAMGFPRYGVFVISSSDPSRPVKDLSNMDEVVAAVNREANRSDEG